MTASPAPCFKCHGKRVIPGSVPALDKPCDACASPAPALLTKELESEMYLVREATEGRTDGIRLSSKQATALLQHIAALEQRVEELEPAAAKWDALSGCARITLLGSSGLHNGDALARPDAHVTLNFWTHNEGGDEQDKEGRRNLHNFVQKCLALPKEPR